MSLITDTPSLAALCRRLADTPFVTVDTEFIREKTYWPQLCLVQLAGPEDAAAIDALADGIDLAPLFELMADPGILKVFHAARQDVEIFFHLTGGLPTPVFDTQVAAMVCGFGDSVGYETLVSKLARTRIDKSSRFTDWSMRPLRKRQIDYALSDVTHLRKVYEKLHRKLADNGREGWLAEEMATLTDPRTYDPDPDQVFRRIRSRSNNPRFLAILREVAAWREKEAQRRDLPRNHVLRDEALIEIAHHTPSTAAELARTRGLGQRLAEGGAGSAIIEAVKRGVDLPDAQCPRPHEAVDLPRGMAPVVDLLKVLLKMKCEEHEAAQKLIASSTDLMAIAAYGEDADVPALRGWRRNIFGADALELRGGGIALAVDQRRIRLVPTGKN